MSFLEKIKSDAGRIYEIRVPDAYGRVAFYRLSIFLAKEAEFKKACKDGSYVDLRQFGEIIETKYIIE